MKFTNEELEEYKKKKLEEIDKYLDQEYGCSYTRLDELFEFIIDQNMKREDEKDKEIARLNNILNELEKFIDDKNKVKLDYDGYIWQLRRPSITCNELKNKLQALKEGVQK